MAGKYINPYTDYGFKRLFGIEENKDLLISFLNSLISDRTDLITDLTYKNIEQIGRAVKQRASYFDVYCETQSGGNFIVEMQNFKQDYFKDRSLFYAAKPISDQGVKGRGWNFRLEEVYMIALMNFVFPSKEYPDDNFYHEIKLMDVTDKHVFYDKLTLIYLEMEKIKKELLNLRSMRDRWMLAFYSLCENQEYPQELQEDIFKKLFHEAKVANLDENELYVYEKSLMDLWDYNGIMQTQYREGREEGLEKGLEKGRKQTVLEVAQKLKAKGLDMTTIMEATGLTIEEVRTL